MKTCLVLLASLVLADAAQAQIRFRQRTRVDAFGNCPGGVCPDVAATAFQALPAPAAKAPPSALPAKAPPAASVASTYRSVEVHAETHAAGPRLARHPVRAAAALTARILTAPFRLICR